MVTAGRQVDIEFRIGTRDPLTVMSDRVRVFQAKSLGDLTQLIAMSHYLGYACVGLVLALVATTTVMSVQDRVKEHAVLQTIGFSRSRVFVLVLAESVVLGVAGGAIGVGVAIIMLNFSNFAISAEAVSIALIPNLRLAVTGLFVALVTGVLAGVAPAWSAARTGIVPSLRAT